MGAGKAAPNPSSCFQPRTAYHAFAARQAESLGIDRLQSITRFRGGFAAGACVGSSLPGEAPETPNPHSIYERTHGESALGRYPRDSYKKRAHLGSLYSNQTHLLSQDSTVSEPYFAFHSFRVL